MSGFPQDASLGWEGGDVMTLTRKDVAATLLTALAVLVFAAAHQSWDVWLVGSSNRWAAVAITLLGAVTCGLGSAGDEMSKGHETSPAIKLLAGIGAFSAVLAIWAVVSGSLTPLSLLVLAVVVLWVASTIRHAWHPAHHPIAT
jgi:hypothetical protein